MVRNLFFLLIILFVSACGFLDGNTTDDKIALAWVDNNYLYIEDIIFLSLQNDSSLIIEKQTDQWIRNQLLLKSAYENVINVNSVENQVLQYKNNLVMFEYEKMTYQNNIDFKKAPYFFISYFRKKFNSLFKKEEMVQLWSKIMKIF